MYIEQMYTGCLAEAAYYIESEGEAVIIDPLREPQPYLDKAAERGATIRYIFETHFHADFVSGHVDLARKSGATIVFGPTAKTTYDIHQASDEEEFTLGKVKLRVLHTPGHTPESSTFLLIDEEGNPHSIFTGDTLFIGDVGRPDLAIKADVTREDLAGMLYDSLHAKIMPLPDHVIVYPGHGAGSACGKNIGSETHSTLGEQKQSNYALQDISREDFITQLTTGILPPPQYFPKNARMNQTGYADFDEVMSGGDTSMDVDAVKEAVAKGALILDTRSQEAFVNSHIPGSVFIGLDGSFAVWVGTLITDIQQPLVLVAEPGTEAEAVKRLARVGYDNTIGYLNGGVKAWKMAGNELAHVNSLSAQKLATHQFGANENIVDVRKPGEFKDSHVTGATSFPLDFIHENIAKLDKEGTNYMHCKGGYRSVIAISLLMRNGYNNLVNVTEGFDAFEGAGVPITYAPNEVPA